MRPVGPRLPERWRLGAALGLLLFLSGCARSPVTPQGAKIESFYNIVLVLAVLVWAGVVAAILWSVVKYRKRKDDDGTLPPQVHGNTTFEVIWTAVPTVIVLALFGMSYSTLRYVDRTAPTTELGAIIEARGFQWSWEFDYGNNIVVRANQGNNNTPVMVVPYGERIRVEERADNVLHSLYVPDFLFKKDVVPGHANAFEFTVDGPGEFFGQCAELCGTGHAVMTFKVRAVPRAEFDRWLVDQAAASELEPCEAEPTADVVIGTDPTELAFDKPCVSVPAGQQVKLTYEHDGAQPHNVAVFTKRPPTGTELAKTEVISSGSATVDVPAQPAGTYYFFCQVHPQMNGSYTAK